VGLDILRRRIFIAGSVHSPGEGGAPAELDKQE
jgi:hypothetical protein